MPATFSIKMLRGTHRTDILPSPIQHSCSCTAMLQGEKGRLRNFARLQTTCGLPVGSYFCFEITKSQETGTAKTGINVSSTKVSFQQLCQKSCGFLFIIESNVEEFHLFPKTGLTYAKCMKLTKVPIDFITHNMLQTSHSQDDSCVCLNSSAMDKHGMTGCC